MKKLKIVLQSKLFYGSLILLIFGYIIIATQLIRYHSAYKDGEQEIIGKILTCSIEDYKISIIVSAKEKIKVNMYLKENELYPNFNIGDKVKIKGKIDSPKKNTIPNTFNYRKYLYNQKIYKTMIASSIDIVNKNTNVLNNVKNYIYKRAGNNKYVSMFVVGDKNLLEDYIYNEFKNIGVAHLLAISGMHVSMLVMILKKLLYRVKEGTSNILISLFLFFYAYLVNFTASILRVVISFILKCFFDIMNIKIDEYCLLILTAFIILLLNPFYIYQIGFLYSFVTVFGIFYTRKYLTKNYLYNLIIISFWTLLFSLPITISLNYEINLLAIISNLFLIPYVTFLLYPLSLITFFLPSLTSVFAVFTTIMEKFIFLLGKIDVGVISLPKLNLLFIILYYAILLCLIYFNYKKFFLLLWVLILGLKLNCFLPSAYLINFFDVGQGDSNLIITPKKKSVILLDTGGLVSFNKKQSTYITDNLILYLKSIGINKITEFIISHGDYDHMGEAINLVNNFKVEKVIFNCGEFNDLETELIKVLDKKKIPYYSCIKELNIDKNKLYFLQTKEYDNENDNSNVIYTELDGYKFMFMGDASITTEKEILSKYNLPDIDVLKVGHHGSKTSSNKEFIDEINPKYSIISVGKNNRYGHPNKEVLDNLKDSKIYRTDEYGSIMFKIKNNKLRIDYCEP